MAVKQVWSKPHTNKHGYYLAVGLRNGGQREFTFLLHHLHWLSVVLETTGNTTNTPLVESVVFSELTLIIYIMCVSCYDYYHHVGPCIYSVNLTLVLLYIRVGV